MFGRKKYRKGRTYLYFISGIRTLPAGGFRNFFSSGKLILKQSMDACEMRDEILAHVRKYHDLPREFDDSYSFTSYHVESN